MNKKPTIPTIGCDPEFFLTDANTGVYVPSCGKIGGSKHKPLIIDADIGLGVLEDNVTLEFNIKPANNIREFHDRMWRAVQALSKFCKSKGLMAQVRPQAQFPMAELTKHPGAMTFGCDPDFEAFKNGEERVPPSPDLLGEWRCAGHHAHFGYDVNKHKMPPWAIVKYLTAFVTLFDTHSLQENGIRRGVYGLPGLYRPKSYGFEWRSPANWLQSYFVGAYKNNTVVQANIILTGLLAAEKRAFDIHPLIDWDAIRGMLTQVLTSRNQDKFHELQDSVADYRQEFYDLGTNILAEAQGDAELVDVANVGDGRRIPFGRPFIARELDQLDAAAQEPDALPDLDGGEVLMPDEMLEDIQPLQAQG